MRPRWPSEAFADPQSIHTPIAKRYIDLLETRTGHPAFHPNAAQDMVELDPRVFACRRTATDGKRVVLCLVNVSSDAVPVSIPTAEAGLARGESRDLVTGNSFAVEAEACVLTLDAYQVLWLETHPA